MAEPAVITKLKHLGLSQRDIAQALRVRESTVSQWTSGKRQMAPEVTADLWDLVCVIEEQVPQGVELQDILRQWQPTTQVTEGGRHDQVVRTGAFPVPPDLLAALEASRGDYKAHDDISLQAALRAIAEYTREDLTPLTAVELYHLRRALRGAQIHLDGMCWARGEGLYPSKPGED
jgi:DNA-binding transcriptional regulator YdaS (Cro superfamily)